MTHLKVFHNGVLELELELKPGHEYIAGRGETCEIILHDESISRKHFKIYFDGSNWVAELISKYGDLIYNGQPMQKIELENSDSFVINQYHFKIQGLQNEMVIHGGLHQQSSSQDEKTESFEITQNDSEDTQDDSSESTAVGFNLGIPYLRVLSPGQEDLLLRLDGEEWHAGRSPESDIQIHDNRASRTHFHLYNTNTGFQIEDLGTPNGTLLNGNAIPANERISLNSGDQIKVGNTTLFFEIRDPSYQEKIKDLPMDLSNPPAMQMSQVHYDPHVGVMRVATPKKKLNPIHIAIALVVFIGIWLATSDNDKDKNLNTHSSQEGPTPVDSTANLSPEQKKYIETSYNLAENLYRQGKYELAIVEIKKVMEITPNYRDAKNIQKLSEEAVKRKLELEEINRSQKEQEALQQKVKNMVEECYRQSFKYNSLVKAHECLAPVLEIDPENPRAKEITERLQTLEMQQEEKLRSQKNYSTLVQSGLRLYEKAAALEKRDALLDAIAAYEEHMRSKYPDPQNLKSKSSEGIKRLKGKVKTIVDEKYKKALAAYNEKRYKDAVTLLGQSIELDPSHEASKNLHSKLIKEVNKAMKEIYSNSVLEENLGNIESAKQSWHLILDTDVPSGEYFEKAKMKLKKYGD